MLFSGDPAFYKDLAKRTPSSTAQGIDLIHLMNMKDIAPTFNVATANDIDIQSTLYKDYLEQFTKRGLDVSLLSPYEKVNKADAQAYITPKRFRELALMLGKWETSHDAMYEKLINDTADEGDYVELQYLMKDVYFPSGQPMKGMHYQLVKDGDLMRPVFLKYSQAVLWPGLIKGTNLQKLSDAMGDKVDEFVFKSGVKVGAKDVSTIDFNTGDIELSPFELDNEFWKLQVDLPSKYDDKDISRFSS